MPAPTTFTRTFVVYKNDPTLGIMPFYASTIASYNSLVSGISSYLSFEFVPLDPDDTDIETINVVFHGSFGTVGYSYDMQSPSSQFSLILAPVLVPPSDIYATLNAIWLDPIRGDYLASIFNYYNSSTYDFEFPETRTTTTGCFWADYLSMLTTYAFMFTIISDPNSYTNISNDPLPYCDPAELSNMYITPDEDHFIPILPSVSPFIDYGFFNSLTSSSYDVIGAFDGVAIDVISADKVFMMCLTATTPSNALYGMEEFFEGWTLYPYIFDQVFTGVIRANNIINSSAGFSVARCDHDNFLVISNATSKVVRAASSSGNLALIIIVVVLAIIVIAMLIYLIARFH